jgi:hypothetical protein
MLLKPKLSLMKKLNLIDYPKKRGFSAARCGPGIALTPGQKCKAEKGEGGNS